MTLPYGSTDPVLRIYLSLAQYPILRTHIRARMRSELYSRGVITPQAFEAAVRDQGVRSQARERLKYPLEEETPEVWETRLERIRNHLTDFYFASNLPFELFEQLVREVLNERGPMPDDALVWFNPELAPQGMLFEQGFSIERMPSSERRRFDARLQEIKVVLIRTMISDQLAYLRIARDWFTLTDLDEIRQRKIGYGKIGGKAAGMLLASRILKEVADEEIKTMVRVPESYFLGADLLYSFMSYNGLMHWGDQKYKPEETIREEYPQIQQEYMASELPADVLDELSELLEQVGTRPLIVRSSSLLEDNFGTSFAGKYDSFFCPNQGSPEANLHDLTQAIARVYASGLNPDALLYRRSMGLQDYDERMAILIQTVEGERFGRYYFPQVAGVSFSKNLYRWSPQIRRNDGFIRMVCGLGTRAVDRVGSDYPRMVALSHPMLRPEPSPKAISRYSQHFIDVIDLEANAVRTLPVRQVLDRQYPALRYLAQVYRDGYLSSIRTSLDAGKDDHLVLTFEDLLNRTPMAERMRTILQLLEHYYEFPIDMEFTLHIPHPEETHPEVKIALLQCRPQSQLQDSQVKLPKEWDEGDVVFATSRNVPHGYIPQIRYILFVTPEGYYNLPSQPMRMELVRAISRLNKALEGETFICVGPGRWGTTTPDLGVRVGYADIYNCRALVELSGQGVGHAPDASFGTHFFQDLVEAQIFPLAIYLDDVDAVFRRDFFYGTPNQLLDFSPQDERLSNFLRLIEVELYRPGHLLDIVMDDEAGKAVAFLVPRESALH